MTLLPRLTAVTMAANGSRRREARGGLMCARRGDRERILTSKPSGMFSWGTGTESRVNLDTLL